MDNKIYDDEDDDVDDDDGKDDDFDWRQSGQINFHRMLAQRKKFSALSVSSKHLHQKVNKVIMIMMMMVVVKLMMKIKMTIVTLSFEAA